MDRFIDLIAISLYIQICFLKSNMDRFIGKNLFYLIKFFKVLKSNMDRFIAYLQSSLNDKQNHFKIQYG